MLVQWFNTAKLCGMALCVVSAGAVAEAKASGDSVGVWSLQTLDNTSNYSRVAPELVQPELLRNARFEPSKIISIEPLDMPLPSNVKFTTGEETLPTAVEVGAAVEAAMLQNNSYVSRKVEAGPVTRNGAMVTWPVLLIAAGVGFLAWSSKRRRLASERADLMFGRGEI